MWNQQSNFFFPTSKAHIQQHPKELPGEEELEDRGLAWLWAPSAFGGSLANSPGTANYVFRAVLWETAFQYKRIKCEALWGVFNENVSYTSQAFQHSVPRWWCCLGRVSLAGGMASLGSSFESSPSLPLPVLSLCFVLAVKDLTS